MVGSPVKGWGGMVPAAGGGLLGGRGGMVPRAASPRYKSPRNLDISVAAPALPAVLPAAAPALAAFAATL